MMSNKPALNCINYIGKHLIIDLWEINSTLLTNEHQIKVMLAEAVFKANAEILQATFHHFGAGSGITGVLLLAESHISIHTWPEYNYAAIDIFMCGKCDPITSVDTILNYFDTKNYNIHEIYRGVIK